ncbi:MAG: immune inhibitor A, partial [Actinobacteria bacterium]|nr:immune inhibitor A [Actinomycetota bacterium]
FRGAGKYIEVWVAKGFSAPAGRAGAYDLEFPSNERARARGFDCRTGPRTTQVTDEQVQYLINEFDNNIYPKSAAAFSTPPARNGSKASASVRNAPFHPGGPGEKIVVLVDNVRDANFYSYQNEARLSRIAGFFYSTINNLFDRNFMTIDAYDFAHLTGANPPNDAFPGALPPIGTLTRLCGNFPGRPYFYESVFAHEYQHLLEQYESPGEHTWVNEGLSDYAQTLTGYVNAAVDPTAPTADSHISCFLGFLPNSLCGGAENSLTLWDDQTNQQNEILADYGAAYTFMLMMSDRYGLPFMSALHKEDLDGLVGFQKVLTQFNITKTPMDLIHEWAALVALDKPLDEGRTLAGGTAATYQAASLRAEVNWNTPEAYSSPGAPPNGSDYVRLRDASGTSLGASQVNSLSFDGASVLPSDPIEWKVVGRTPLDASNPVLYSGTGNNLDRAIVKEVAVPTANPTLTFLTDWNMENHWDFGFVQVSTDGGVTYKTVTCTDTTTETDPDAIEKVKANVPGYTGDSGGYKNESCNLSAYAGTTVLLSFRYVTDPAVEGESDRVPPGWYLDDIAIGGTIISDGGTLSGFRSLTEVRPTPIKSWYVQLVGYHTTDRSVPAVIGVLKLDANFDVTLDRAALQAIIGSQADLVGAIVTFDDPTESIVQYGPYKLTVNGVLQPGGS